MSEHLNRWKTANLPAWKIATARRAVRRLAVKYGLVKRQSWLEWLDEPASLWASILTSLILFAVIAWGIWATWPVLGR